MDDDIGQRALLRLDAARRALEGDDGPAARAEYEAALSAYLTDLGGRPNSDATVDPLGTGTE